MCAVCGAGLWVLKSRGQILLWVVPFQGCLDGLLWGIALEIDEKDFKETGNMKGPSLYL